MKYNKFYYLCQLLVLSYCYTFHLKMSFLSNMFTPNNNIKKVIDKSPTLNELDILLRSLETVEERFQYECSININNGRGMSSHKANIRLFDAPDNYIPEIVLYRDTAGWCPYCEKVWLYLEEKRIPYSIIKVPMNCYGKKPDSFYKISPSGGIPIAIIKGKVISESNDIIYYIEKEYSNESNKLLPSDVSTENSKSLLKLERKLFSCWFSWLTSKYDSENEMHEIFKQVDNELLKSGGPYFLGSKLSIIDIMYAPFLERMAASLPYFKGFECRSSKYPNLLKWYEAMDTRESYIGIKSDYYTHVNDLPPQIGTCYYNIPKSTPYKDQINGDVWNINVNVEDCFEPMMPYDSKIACRDAVRNCIGNFENIVNFAARGCGQKGFPQVSAPLSDPNAISNSNYKNEIDIALRFILYIMLKNEYNYNDNNEIKEMFNSFNKVELVKCLEYLRDRISVPRDMYIHSARQLRAHLNYFIRLI